ncbi:lipopolysaccharide biosynthesis protein [Egicoccus sp. AB-alg2]|uniref:lipopolysaccharide biosynthesis protein n=1 Tax=Egicoccus sp. AB-alg2 TaxID=3242693 RepID=UPI00359E96FF
MSDEQPLARRAVGGLAYLFLGQGGQMLVQLITLPILARLIAPESFGLVAATFVVVNMAFLLSTAGLSTALIKLETMRPEHLRVALTMQVGAAVVVFGGVALAAGRIGDALRLDGLAPVLQVMALAYFVRTLSLGDVVLSRQLRFRPLAVIQLVGYVVGYGVVTVGLAAAGWGVWALTGGHLVASVAQIVLLWLVAPHPFLPLLRRGPARDLLGTGLGYTISHAGYIVAHEADNLVVGRWLGAHALGLYERAYRLMRMPASVFGHILGEVLYPSMAAVQDERHRVRNMFCVSTASLAALTVPTTVAVWLLTHEIVLLLLGPQWLPMRTALNIIVFGMYLKASEAVTDSVIVATGAVYRLARLRWLYAAAVVTGAVVGQRWGLPGVATGALAAMALNTTVLTRLSLQRIDLSWSAWATLHAPAAVLTVAVGAFVWPTSQGLRGLGLPPALVLAGSLLAAAVAILLATRLSPRWRVTTALSDLVGQLAALVTAPRSRRVVVALLGTAHVRAARPDAEEVPL